MRKDMNIEIWCDDLMRIIQKHKEAEEKLEKIFTTLDELEMMIKVNNNEEEKNG